MGEIEPFPEQEPRSTISIEPRELYQLYRAFGGGRLNFIMDEEMITIVTDHEAMDAKWGDRLVRFPKGWRVESA